MKRHRLTDFTRGWFIGDFEPSVLKTEQFEVGYLFHPKGQEWPDHYHKLGTEYNLLVRGSMRICGETIEAGELFIIEPYEVADPEFLEDCYIMCIKSPGNKGDKYLVKDDKDNQ
jgi:quercetin dioxygenase-like cupin family protein